MCIRDSCLNREARAFLKDREKMQKYLAVTTEDAASEKKRPLSFFSKTNKPVYLSLIHISHARQCAFPAHFCPSKPWLSLSTDGMVSGFKGMWSLYAIVIASYK